MKKFIILLLSLLLSLTLMGCENEEIDKDLLANTISKFENNTQKAIEEKNSQLARDIWSEITEYSIKAEKLADENLNNTLTTLASTYVKLVKYCETGDEDTLKEFKSDFQKASHELEEILQVMDKEK